ncbi:MAG: HTH domain-containing protein [Methylomarinum sp.]|nr:HTH domain-containing protein [Methylomarinum sp.]
MGISGFSEKQQKILQFLIKEKDGMTIDQFSKRLTISKSAVHQHMTVLERDGFVKKFSSIQTAGRPSTSFVLTEKGINVFPKHYNLFAEMLIKLIKQKLGTKELIEYLQELGVSLSETKKESLKNKPLDEKIEMTVAIMQELGYDAYTVEGEPGQSQMIDAYNCVFHDLATNNEEVCELDLSLLSSLLDSKIEHVCCMTKGGKKCQFKVLACYKDS